MGGIVLLRGGCFDGSTGDDLNAIVARQRASGRRLVVHFHGGLVDQAHGLAIAGRLQPVYEQARGDPLFVIWQSGLGDAIRGRLEAIARENIFSRLLARLIQFTIAKSPRRRPGARAITLELPALVNVAAKLEGFTVEPYAQLEGEFAEPTDAEEQQLLAILQEDQVIEREGMRILAGLRAEHDGGATTYRSVAAAGEQATATLMSEEVLEMLASGAPGQGERAIVTSGKLALSTLKALRHILARLRTGRGHGVYCTAVEELLRELYLGNAGGTIWRQMKRETEESFGPAPARHGGTALLAALADGAPGQEPPLLVGHSTGGLYICNLIAHADTLPQEEASFDIAMLAPACDFDFSDRLLVAHARRVRRIRIFAMSDQNERRDQLVARVYPRSLLYLVSGLLEREADMPLLGMQRFHSGAAPFTASAFPAVGRVRERLAADSESCVWSAVQGTAGCSSQALRHGDFDDDAVTLASVAHMIGTR